MIGALYVLFGMTCVYLFGTQIRDSKSDIFNVIDGLTQSDASKRESGI